MDKNEVHKELSKFGKSVVKAARSRVKKNSGDLEGSIGFDLDVYANSFSMSFFMADYGIFVDEGVRGAGGTRKTTSKYDTTNNRGKIWKQKGGNSRFSFKDKKPPLSVFEKYANNRGHAFAIQESVFRQGLKPSLFFTKPFEDAFMTLSDRLIEKFGLDIDQFLEDTLLGTEK